MPQTLPVACHKVKGKFISSVDISVVHIYDQKSQDTTAVNEYVNYIWRLVANVCSFPRLSVFLLLKEQKENQY